MSETRLWSDFVVDINYALRGTDDDAPATGTDEDTYWMDAYNRVKNRLYRNAAKNWRYIWKATTPNEPGTVATSATTTLTGTGTYFTDYSAGDTITVDGETVRTIDTITSDTSLTVTAAFTNTASSKTFTKATIIQAGVQTYSAHRSLLMVSGSKDGDVYVTKTDSTKSYFSKIQPEESNPVRQAVHLSGRHPEIITFTRDIDATNDLVGGTLFVPGYYLPDNITADTDIIELPDPDWGVYAVAAEIAFADITYEDKTVDLNAKANELYRQMVAANRKGSHNTPRVTPTNTYKIRGL